MNHKKLAPQLLTMKGADLSPYDYRVLMYLLGISDHTLICMPKIESIVAITNISKRQVIISMQKLEDQKLITFLRPSGLDKRSKLYKINFFVSENGVIENALIAEKDGVCDAPKSEDTLYDEEGENTAIGASPASTPLEPPYREYELETHFSPGVSAGTSCGVKNLTTSPKFVSGKVFEEEKIGVKSKCVTAPQEVHEAALRSGKPSSLLDFWRLLYEQNFGIMCVLAKGQKNYSILRRALANFRSHGDLMVAMRFAVNRFKDEEPLFPGSELVRPTFSMFASEAVAQRIISLVMEDSFWRKSRYKYNLVALGDQMENVFPSAELERMKNE